MMPEMVILTRPDPIERGTLLAWTSQHGQQIKKKTPPGMHRAGRKKILAATYFPLVEYHRLWWA